MVIHGRAGRKIVWEIRPLTTRLIDIQNRVPHPPQIHFLRATRPYLFFLPQAFFHHRPLFIRQITGVSLIRPHFEFSTLLIQTLNL